MKSFKRSEIGEAINYIRHLDVEEQFDKIEIDSRTLQLKITSAQLEDPIKILLKPKDEVIAFSDELEKYLSRRSKIFHAFKYLKDKFADKDDSVDTGFDILGNARVLIEKAKSDKEIMFVINHKDEEILVSVAMKIEKYGNSFFESRVFQSEEKMHLGKVKEILDKFEAALK